MSTLVSPGVSVSLINDSFFFPTVSSTVPVFFIATRAGKYQTDGVTLAAGTLEHSVVRTVTSISQSLALYGIPYFHNDISGSEYHGDARNEYGLLALNQFLGTGNLAYVIRANIDLNDDQDNSFISFGTPFINAASKTFNGIGNGTLDTITCYNNTIQPQTFTVTFTTPTTFSVIGTVAGYVGTGNVGVPFSSSVISFNTAVGSTPFVAGDLFTFAVIYRPTPGGSNTGNGGMRNLLPDVNAVPETWTVTMTTATAFTVSGTVSGSTAAGTVGSLYDNGKITFTIFAGSTPFVAGDVFTVIASRVTLTDPLGSNDVARRLSIVTALQAEVNSNVDIRSELYEFTLCACPGYWEVVDELAALVIDIKEEALVIADTPYNLNPDQVATWGLTSARTSTQDVAYYYPWCLTSNLDGRDVLGAPSGTALRTIAYSDQQAYVWEAPAGTQRGVVTGVSQVGYVTGTAGTATTFIQVSLNQGQRDNLYEYYTNINPIVYFPGRGILIWGQKTSAPAASAMDRINVARLVCYLRRVLRKGAFPFVFEPNDAITRANLKAAADGLLSDVMAKRGLYDFATLCDASNNTPERIQANELWLNVAIDPTKAGEFIYIELQLVATGALS